MSLLSEIRDLAADNSVPLETVLLKCMVLADVLGDETLMQWLSQELGGYQKRGDVPDYRVMHGQAIAKVTNGVRYERIDVSCIALPQHAPTDAYKRLNTVYFTDGVRELEMNQHRDDLVRILDADLKHYIEQNSRDASGYWVRDAYIPIPPGAVAGVLGAIRSRVLQYIFRLRKDFPQFDMEATREHAPTPAQLTQVFQMSIGEGSAVSIGGNAFSQSIRQQIVAGDLASLKRFLRDIGVEQDDLDALDAVIADSKPSDIDIEQSAIRRWIGKIAEKAAGGGTELAKTAAREIIQQAVKYFFGMGMGAD